MERARAEHALRIRSGSARGWGVVQFGIVAVGVAAIAVWDRSVALGVLAAVLFGFAIRAARLEARCSVDELLVRNLFWTWHIATADVEDFELQEGWRFSAWLRLPGSRVVCVRRGKRAVPLLGTQWIHWGRTDFYGQPVVPPTETWLFALRRAAGR